MIWNEYFIKYILSINYFQNFCLFFINFFDVVCGLLGESLYKYILETNYIDYFGAFFYELVVCFCKIFFTSESKILNVNVGYFNYFKFIWFLVKLLYDVIIKRTVFSFFDGVVSLVLSVFKLCSRSVTALIAVPFVSAAAFTALMLFNSSLFSVFFNLIHNVLEVLNKIFMIFVVWFQNIKPIIHDYLIVPIFVIIKTLFILLLQFFFLGALTKNYEEV